VTVSGHERSTLVPPSSPTQTGVVEARPYVDFEALERNIDELHSRYSSAHPFPHIVIDDFLDPELALQAMKDFPGLAPEEWNSFIHANEKKYSNTRPETWPPVLQGLLEVFQGERFVQFLTRLTGIEDLLIDESLMGGGLHYSGAGGFLNIHADFTVHPHRRTWRRRVNLLLYLNEQWQPEYGGDLELWSTDMKRCEQKVAPAGNRAVIFTTNADSFHGHPEPMRCPPELARKSLALYYFTQEDRPLVRSTEYRARPGDGVKALVIYLDKEALRGYDWAKRKLGLSDHTAGKLLDFAERLRGRRPKT
jgi:Rps23 Pro-64 3,4-dihydroxylase Tpa1-like proline 4-hydroxylase